jgi:DNA topoisomerase IB
VRLIETTLFRIGNIEYAKANKSYGLTALHDRHIEIEGSHIHLDFRGKLGIRHETDINDRRLRTANVSASSRATCLIVTGRPLPMSKVRPIASSTSNA